MIEDFFYVEKCSYLPSQPLPLPFLPPSPSLQSSDNQIKYAVNPLKREANQLRNNVATEKRSKIYFA